MSDKITSKQLLGQLLQKHYDEALEAKKRGELVAWSTSIAPNEFCETMGIHVVYPENHAAAIGAKGGAIPLLETAEGLGYSVDLCSYARINLGYIKTLDCVADNIPLPDFIICCNNICNTLIKWYENIAAQLSIPMIMIDVPFNHERQVTQARVEYIKAQFTEAIGMLEKITGKDFDYERFYEVMRISAESCRYWKHAMSLAQQVPSPLNGFDIFNYMALIVCMRGKQGCIDTFKLLSEELEESIRQGRGAFKEGEKHRIMWEGIACWPYLGHNFKTLKSYGINMVGSTYPDAWALLYEPGDLDAMARAYSSIVNNCCLEQQVEYRTGVIKDFRCDGTIYHLNRSCKIMDFLQYEQQRQIAPATNVPFISFDGDQTDPRNFAQAQFETRVQALVEMMEEQKKAANNSQGGVEHV